MKGKERFLMKIEDLKRGLIVSCQATKEEPMHGSDYMAHMALAAQMGGAVGVRINSVSDIRAAKELINIPIIGIIKQDYEGTPVRITPTLKEILAVYEAGAEIVAVDCTFRKRPSDIKIPELIEITKKECPGMLFMADVETLEEGIFAAENGADIVASTLAGYPKGPSETPIEFISPSLDIVGELAKHVKVPVIAEGRMGSAENAIKALKLGAHAAVIGWGITRPQIITQKIVMEINEYLESIGKEK